MTLSYMPAGMLHEVISKSDCIAIGRHGIPASNVTECVLTTLHNVMLSNVITNADHEPARRLLLRMFAFFAMAVLDPYNEQMLDEEFKSLKHRQEFEAREDARNR